MIDYILKISDRKSTAIKVIDNQVVVYTNKFVKKKDIEELILKNMDKINSKMKDDSVFSFLGKDYDLIYKESSFNKYEFKGQQLYIYYTKKDNISLIKENILIDNQNILLDIVNKCVDGFEVKPKKIQIKRLKRTFGICHSNYEISISINVLHYRVEFMEMVVFHELCHLIHMNHGKGFYDLLKKYVPDYKLLVKEVR
ncbi:MAG: SprT-like domain-containing protein [Erysipelotrichaceae bacterium]